MVTAWVLVDAVPGMKDRVFANLDRLKPHGLAAKAKVSAGNFDIVLRLEVADEHAVDNFIGSHLRFISGIGACRRIKDPALEAPQVQAAVRQLAGK